MAEAVDDKPNETPGEGGEGGGKPAGDKPAGDSTPAKTYTQSELDAALAADRQARNRAAKAKAGKSGSAKPKDEGGEDEELSKERQRREAAEEQLRVRDARDSVEKAAKDAGFQNPGKIYRLLKDDLSFDDAGKPENVKDLITIAKRDFPEELGSGKGRGSADGGERGAGKVGGGGMNSLIRKAAGYHD